MPEIRHGTLSPAEDRFLWYCDMKQQCLVRETINQSSRQANLFLGGVLEKRTTETTGAIDNNTQYFQKASMSSKPEST